MTSSATPTYLAEPGPEAEDWSTIALIRRHKLAAAGAAAMLLILVALLAAALAAPHNGAVSDSTSCSTWGSATQAQQQAFATHYLSQHGNLIGWGPGAAGVLAAVNGGCEAAFSTDVEDKITVLDAIEGRY